MDCLMGGGIHSRVNGEINCHGSTGERVALAELSLQGEGWNFIHDFRWVYVSESIREFRERIGVDDLVLGDAHAEGFAGRPPREQP